MSKPVSIDDSDFEQTVLQAKVPVLVDFWAPWCKPCLMAAPMLEELAEEYDGRIAIVKLDIDQNSKTAVKYGVMAIPNLIIFKNGEPFSQIVGFQPKPKLKKALDTVLE